MTTLKGHWYRGGTSKCWIFGPEDLSGSREHVTDVLVKAFGASDARQLSGVGGGTSTTSKAAVISPFEGEEADINFLFAQVGIGKEAVEYTSNCGNCSAAVGLFALDQGLVEPADDVTRVRIYNENTGAFISTYIPTPAGRLPEQESVAIPGVEDPGYGVDVTFERVDGVSTGALLPTGRPLDSFEQGRFEAHATCIDAGAPACLISAESLGATGAENLETIRNNLLDSLLTIRSLASVRMGLSESVEKASPAIPKVGVVGGAQDYTTLTGTKVSADEYDISVRMLSMFDAHPAIGITSAVAIARSALVEGSVVNSLLRAKGLKPSSDGFTLRMGTLSGVIETTLRTSPDDGSVSVSLLRSAHHIADAEIFI